VLGPEQFPDRVQTADDAVLEDAPTTRGPATLLGLSVAMT